MARYLGIDIGSLSCDAVIVDQAGAVIASAVVPTGARNLEAIRRASREVLERAGLSEADIRATVSTGYGRERVDGRAAAVTEITCHARGIRALYPDVQVLIDIGGQDSKAMRIAANGRVADFAMNDKCAAGTGRFLEAMARALEVDIDRLGDLDLGATGHPKISSMCTVFAESEVVSLLAQGTGIADIAGALHRAIAGRTFALAKRVAPDIAAVPVAMSGGVARNQGVVRAIAELIGRPLLVPEAPDTIGALGAALIAREQGGAPA